MDKKKQYGSKFKYEVGRGAEEVWKRERSEEIQKRSEEDTGSQDLIAGSQDKSLIYFSHLVSSGNLIWSHL